MELKYIIELCVAIDIAILGIAYPIIVVKISNMGHKFSSIISLMPLRMNFHRKNSFGNYQDGQEE